MSEPFFVNLAFEVPEKYLPCGVKSLVIGLVQRLDVVTPNRTVSPSQAFWTEKFFSDTAVALFELFTCNIERKTAKNVEFI